MDREQKRIFISAVPRESQRQFSGADWDAALEFIARVFGHETLRPEQKIALEALFTGKNLLALLPTGFGKTLSFTSLVLLYDYLFNGAPGSASRLQPTDARFFRPILFVISPLTQLILNHVNSFNSDVKKAGHAHLKALCAYNSVQSLGASVTKKFAKDSEILCSYLQDM